MLRLRMSRGFARRVRYAFGVDESAKPKLAIKHRWRRAAMAGAVAVAVGAFAVVVAWAARPQLAALVVESWLRANGAPDAALTVTELRRDGMRIEGLVLGGGAEEAAAEAIDVDYRLNGFGLPTIRAVSIDALQLYVTPDAEKPLGALSDVIASLAEGDGDAAAGPPVKCFNCRVVLRTAAGAVNVDLSGQVAPAEKGYEATALWTADSRFGTLGGQFAGSFTPDGSGKAQLDVTEGKIAWPERNVAAEGMTGNVRLELAAGALAALGGQLRSGKLTQADLPTVALSLDFDYRPEAARLSLSAVDPGNSFVAKIDADVADPQNAPTARLHADLSFDETAPVWSLTGLPAPSTGRTDVGAEFELALPPLGEIASLSLPENFTADLNIDLQGLAWPGYVSAVTGTGRMLLERAAGQYSITSEGPVAVRGVLDPAQRAKLTLPAGIADKIEGRLIATVADGSTVALIPEEAGFGLAGNGTIRINNPSDLLISARGRFTADPGLKLAAFAIDHGEIWTTHWSLDPANIDAAVIDSFLIKGSAKGTPAGATGHAQVFAVGLSVEAGGAFAKRAAANLKLDYSLDAGNFTAILTDPGTLAAEGLVLPGLRSETQSVTLRVRPDDTPLLLADLAAEGGPLLQHAVKLDGFAMTVEPESGGDGPISLVAPSASLVGQWSPAAGWHGEVAVYNGRALIPARELAAEGITARMRLGAGRSSGRIDVHVGALSLGPAAAAVPKLTVDGVAVLAGNSVEFDLTAADPQRILSLAVNGTHDLETGNGAGQIHVAPIHFSPGGLQPRDLLPELGDRIEEATGVVSLGGGLAWKRGAVFGDTVLRIEDLSLTGPDFDIARMNGAIALQGLSPLRTKPDQQIAVASVDLGLPLYDGLATFSIAPGPLIAIKAAELHMAGGTVDIEPVTLDPNALEGTLRLHVHNVDLEELLALAEVTGLSGTGRLDGVIPVTIKNGVTTIAGARLDAQAPGRLAYAPDAPPPALQDGSETVSLVMSALANFQYEKLWLTLDRQATGDAEIGLHVTGKNPDFYDGYPIEFNLSLAGKLDQILKDSLVGYRVPDLVRERLEATRPAAGVQ